MVEKGHLNFPLTFLSQGKLYSIIHFQKLFTLIPSKTYIVRKYVTKSFIKLFCIMTGSIISPIFFHFLIV